MSDTHPYWPWTRVRNQHVILDLIRRGELKIEPLVSHVERTRRRPSSLNA